MTDPGLVALLACPLCKGPLQARADSFRCEPCRRDYPVADGIPDFG